MYDAIEFRGNLQAEVETLAEHAGVPVYNGLTAEWHPTQMLADFLTMHEASGKPYDGLSYAYLGDCRFNMGRSLLIMGALMGSDVRLAGPADLQPPKDVVALAEDIAGRTGARITLTEDPGEAVEGVDFIHTDVWVSMGEAKDVWQERVTVLSPYQVNAGLLGRTGNRSVKFMHCLPAFHDTNTVVGREIMEHTGMTSGLEVTDEVFGSAAEHRLRPGREPAAHHQGDPGRHPRLTAYPACRATRAWALSPYARTPGASTLLVAPADGDSRQARPVDGGVGHVHNSPAEQGSRGGPGDQPGSA